MYFLDKKRGKNGRIIYKTKADFNKPIQKDRLGKYKIQSGEMLRVCMTSDFFLAEADQWRDEVWNMIWERRDVKFFLLTKRPERVADCLPKDWGAGWDNVFLNVSCENQKRADERIPILLQLPFKHKGIMCAPLIDSVSIANYLHTGQIEQVIAGGENYDGARPCNYDWVVELAKECRNENISFIFTETGSYFIKDSRMYHLPGKQLQSQMAFKSGISYQGRSIHYDLYDSLGISLSDEDLYQPIFRTICQNCGSRPICNGYTKECGSSMNERPILKVNNSNSGL